MITLLGHERIKVFFHVKLFRLLFIILSIFVWWLCFVFCSKALNFDDSLVNIWSFVRTFYSGFLLGTKSFLAVILPRICPSSSWLIINCGETMPGERSVKPAIRVESLDSYTLSRRNTRGWNIGIPLVAEFSGYVVLIWSFVDTKTTWLCEYFSGISALPPLICSLLSMLPSIS